MLDEPFFTYPPFPPIDLPDRQWPSRRNTKAPRWLSTDLRDGNQAIFEPMDAETKLAFFRLLRKIGFKEIEIGFPSASQIEFDFVRSLIEDGYIPDDVSIQVLTSARPELIARTMESVRGAKQAIIHCYVATSDQFQGIVLNKSRQEVIDMAVASTRQIRELAAQQPETNFTLEFSPEHFSQTDLDYAREFCDAVVDAWGATPQRKVILNLPATVEICEPSDYADMIEWMGRNLQKRDSVVISVHPHNDRNTAVAAAEMALKAGADRVEGCLLGNGERTGNVDLVSLALNMYTKGVHPRLNFSDLLGIARAVEGYTGIPVHPRHPYVGDLAYTAFSGSHQDAMAKGMEASKLTGQWNVPYMPINPADIGRTLDGVIKINSQSGKGGIDYILRKEFGLQLPRRALVEFSGAVQSYAEALGGEVNGEQIWSVFRQEYELVERPIRYEGYELCSGAGGKGLGIVLNFEVDGEPVTMTGYGNGPIDAAIDALKLPITIQSFEERSLGKGSDAKAVSFLEMAVEGVPGTHYGIGIDGNTVTASIKAIVSGVNRGVGLGKLGLTPEFRANAVAVAPMVPGGGTPGGKGTVFAANFN